MADVVDLGGHPSTRAAPVQDEVVSQLEGMLVKAKNGQIQHLACVWLDSQGVPWDAYSGGGHPQEVVGLIGAVELFKLTVLAQIKDQ